MIKRGRMIEVYGEKKEKRDSLMSCRGSKNILEKASTVMFLTGLVQVPIISLGETLI